jgi:NAD+ kinase
LKKLANKIKRVGLIANPEKVSCRSTLRRAVDLLRRARRSVLAEFSAAQFVPEAVPVCPDAGALAATTDLILVFGGDGTMLRVSREVAGHKTPILGINVGGLGFLTAVPSQQLTPALARIWAGEFRLEARSLIEAAGAASGHSFRQVALNDFVISRGAESRMIELEVSVDQQILTRYRCDGLIISSPTGSTAYSLSAGGAVITPNAEVLALTPICPHTLSNRSVVVSLDSIVQVKVLSQRLEIVLTADGQVQTRLAAGDIVTIRRSRKTVRLLHLAGSSFFDTLRKKLHWSGSSMKWTR